MDLPEGSLRSNPAVSVVWAPEFWQIPAWAAGADLMFADAASWNRPIRSPTAPAATWRRSMLPGMPASTRSSGWRAPARGPAAGPER